MRLLAADRPWLVTEWILYGSPVLRGPLLGVCPSRPRRSGPGVYALSAVRDSSLKYCSTTDYLAGWCAWIRVSKRRDACAESAVTAGAYRKVDPNRRQRREHLSGRG